MKNLKNLTLLSVMLVASSLGAQENVGMIVGVVRDAQGAPIANANIRITGPQLLQPRVTVTDASGRYRLQLILPGEAVVAASKQGYIGARQNIHVSASSTLSVDFSLRTLTTQTEEIEIIANDNPAIDKTETKVASTYGIDTLRALPTGQTGVFAALYLAPGVGGTDLAYAKIRGGTYGQAAYTINGVSMRDPEVGGGTQAQFSIEDLVQDVQVTQNAINARYGFTSSGSVNITTKTGTNSFSGSVRVTLSNAAWNTYNTGPVNNRFSEMLATSTATEFWSTAPPNPREDETSKTYFVTLSGPIIKDRLTFTYGIRYNAVSYGNLPLTYNPLRTDPVENLLYLPGLTSSDPKFTGPQYSIPGNPEMENWAAYLWGRDPMTPTKTYSVPTFSKSKFDQYKLFWQITPNHQVDFNYSSNPTMSLGPNAGADRIDPSITYPNSTDATMRGVNYKGIIGSHAVLEVSWGRRYTKTQFPVGPDDSVFVLFHDRSRTGILERPGGGAAVITGGAGSYGATRDGETVSIALNYIWQAHNFDVGLQRLNERVQTGGVGINNRRFFSPGMRWDGKYMVYNADSDAGGPIWVNDGRLQLQSGETFLQRQSWLLGGIPSGAPTANSRIPYLIKYSAGRSDPQPHDGQTTAFYLNDNWAFSDKLAFNIGLRFDQTLVGDNKGRIVNALDILPRLRVQYDLSGDNKHVFGLSYTQSVGTLNRANMGSYASGGRTPVERTYFWSKGSPEPYFVDLATLKDESNYGYYYRYSQATLGPWWIDPDLHPERTDAIDLSYRRAFSQGGYFRVSLVYNQLSNALSSDLVDVVVELKDPTGEVPRVGSADTYARLLSNKSDRGRHHAAAEMEWSMPVIKKPTYRLTWEGNWTIAKTTGNFIFQSTNSGNNAEASGIRFIDQLVAIGMDRQYVDPWGETGGQGRNVMKTWLILNHGDKGGVQNSLSLLAAYDSALPDPITWSYTLPSGTFKSTVAGGGTVPNGSAPATSATLFPYGRGHRVQASDTYSLRARWQVVFPIKGTLVAISNFAVNNVFNTQINNQPTTNWTAGTTRIWQNGQKPGEEGDRLWGKNVAARTEGQNWGVYSSGGARNFNVNVDFGLRF